MESSKGLVTYQLDREALEKIHQKYGQPGEIAPGVKAPRKRTTNPTQAPGALPILEND
ncbi:hypothetical protein [Heliophilum fasciatum]|uniref:Uncharacterized protein n=1 Tax=Heliophilum fasciatum TaxID=35700 RepID=A0A4R2RV13_9FIRM|nr:hypothetical protein [Heliophilum fasciatum]MCW2277408.1 hypothetical protein [Heliophilum fasciatum]TCP67244.1 hypothetical protein EDD73_105142 [Heliophilum fasciatum]